MIWKLKVIKPYRRLVTNVTRSGYVQRIGSSKPKIFRTRKEATNALVHIVRSNFPRSRNRQSAAAGIIKITKR